MSPEQAANEAKRLLEDRTFKSALSTVYENAREALVTVNVNDRIAVLRLQQKAQVIEEILAELQAAVLRMARPEEQTVP
jgi:hypothetical protein